MPNLTPCPTPLHVLVVEDDTLVGLGLKSNLEGMGHRVTGPAATPEEAQRLFREDPPDLVLIDIRLDEGDGTKLAATLRDIRRVPMIAVSAYSDADLVRRATEAGVFGYLVKPVTPETLAAQIEVAVQRSRDQSELMERNESLTKQLESRKIIERAKGILMTRLNLSEPEAHKRLQVESQKRRLALPELAQKIIESEELLGGQG